MEDLAEAIVSRLEPTEPIGYRVVMFHCESLPIFEAKAVPFKGGLGFLTRSAFNKWPLPPVNEYELEFAPSFDSIKYLLRRAIIHIDTYEVTLMPPGTSLVRNYREIVSMANGRFQTGNEFDEARLNEMVGAMMVMKVPPGLRW
jgi:hypothetical protein